MARQESRLLWLKEGDAPTSFFHAHVNGRRWKKHIHSLKHEGRLLLIEENKAEVALNFFEEILGTLAMRSNSINLAQLDLLQLHMPN
jgi:hypothetical protein